MEWVILFLISWILMLLLVDWRAVKKNVWCGLLAMAMQLFVDTQFISHRLYEIKNQVLELWGSSVFFAAGPVFVIGVLLAQFYPKKRWAQIVHVIFLTLLYSLQELLLLKTGKLAYLNWHHFDSIGVNTAAMGLLGWFSIVVLKKGGNAAG